MIRKPLLLAAALLAAATTLFASRAAPARSLVEIDLIDRDSGQTLPEYRHRGQAWVPGEPGHRYAVRLTNTSGERVLVVLSVDGVNAVDGRTASPTQAGYVLAPWQSAEIAGWRKSLDDVAQFYFTDLPDSYAARTGRPDNVGVIGIAVFRESPPPRPSLRPYQDVAKSTAVAAAAERPAPTAAAAEAASPALRREIAGQRLGTGHGARAWAPVSSTHFVRASSRPAQLTQLSYDDAGHLAALGIVPRRHHYWDRDEPRAFPGAFVADPPGS